MMIIQALPAHYNDIVRIYNQAVIAGSQTADENVVSVEEKLPWLKSHSGEHYIIYVATNDKNNAKNDAKILGYLALSPYRYGRSAFRKTAEISYYVDSNYQKQGIGTKLMAHAISQCPELDIESLVAVLLSCNSASIAILKKFNFEQWGSLPKLARLKQGRVDHFYYGRHLRWVD